MKIHFTIEASGVSTKDVLVTEIARLAQYIQMAAAGDLQLEPPRDDQICIGRIYEVTIDDIKVPCVALIVNAVICLPGMGGRVAHRLDSVLVPEKTQRWHRSVLINGRSRPCFVIRLSDFYKGVDASRLTDEQRRIFDRVHRAIASNRYYLIPAKSEPPTIDVSIDGVTLTADGLAKIIKDRKKAAQHAGHAALQDGHTSLAGELALAVLARPLQQHDLDELLKTRRAVIVQAGNRLAELDAVIDKASATAGPAQVKEGRHDGD